MSSAHADGTTRDARLPAGGAGRHEHPGAKGFAWLGHAVLRRPWQVIAAWIVAAIALTVTSPALPGATGESSFLPKSYESIRAADLQARAFPQVGSLTRSAAVIVFARAGGGKLTAADSARVAAIAASLSGRHIRNIHGITPAPPSPNKLVQAALVTMPAGVLNGSGNAAGETVRALRADIGPLMAGSGLSAGVTGLAAQDLDSQQSADRADKIVLLATLVLILALLLIIFRSPILALLPLMMIAVAAPVAAGLIADVNEAARLGADSSISPVIIVVLFGVGTDYFLFLLFRYRERLRGGGDSTRAMVSAVTHAGQAIATAAGVVIASFLALLLSSLSVLRAIGPALAIAVVVTLAAALTLVPAVVSLLGPRIFWPSRTWQQEPNGARYAAIGASLGRRPALFAAGSALVLAALTASAFSFHATFGLGAAAVPKTAQSQTALRTLEKGLPPGAIDPAEVLLHARPGRTLNAGELRAYGTKLKTLDGVSAVAPPKLSTGKTTADYTVTLSLSPQSTAAVRAMQGPIRHGAHAAAPAGTYALVGGTTAVYADLQRAISHDYALVFPIAAAIILLMLALTLRSAVAPWYLMASVGLGFGAALGASVLFFQDLRGGAGLIFLLPVYIYVFVVALGTDYNILMTTRLREEAMAGRPPREAAAMATRHAGPTVGAAGLVLAGTFASLTLAGNSILSQLGFAVSTGITLAAFVMATFLAPSLTALIGHRAWWPTSGPYSAHTPPGQRKRCGNPAGQTVTSSSPAQANG